MRPSTESFGHWVRQHRRHRALTQKALGRMIGYAEITVRQIEHDSYNLTHFVVECLVNALADEDDNREALIRFALAQSAGDEKQASQPTIYGVGTPFYGRDSELNYLASLLNTPECRCISIIGVGGVGKTRLALRALEVLDNATLSDAHFINLTAITSVELVPSTIADALGFSLSPFTPPLEQLIQQLQVRTSLLVLDNFEQLLPDGVDLIQAILTRAPQVKILITSRERLSLPVEWCIRLEGLDTAHNASRLSEAAELFVSTARRINNRFTVTNVNVIMEICRLVQGMPLAIEMAASWTEVQSCEEILAGISEQMLALTTRQKGIDDRHRNLGIVFEATWAKLSRDEQTALKRLSVFNGGFTMEAARTAVQTTTAVLAFLHDKMLIQAQGERRFVLHELIRQLAYQKLAADAHELAQAKLAHTEYFLDWIANSPERLKYHHTRDEIIRLSPEIDNLRVMWEMICETRNTDWFERSWETLWLFFNVTSRFYEGEQFFKMVLNAIDSATATPEELHMRCHSQIMYGFYAFREGRIPDAYDILFSPEMESYLTSTNLTDQYWVGLIESFLYHAMGDIPKALASTSVLLSKLGGVGNSAYYTASVQMQLGRVKHLMGDIDGAYVDLAEGVRISRQSGLAWGEGLILTELGFLAEADDKLADALGYYEAALATTTAFEELWNYQRTQISIGRVRMALGQVKEAVNIQKITLQALLANPALGFEIDCFVEVATILKHFGDAALAVVLLEYCASNPECFQPTRDRANQYLAAIRKEMPALDLSAARNLFPVAKADVGRMLLKRLTEIYRQISAGSVENPSQ